MEKDQIKEIDILYTTENWVSEEAFIESENYFKFYDEILQQIDELNALENGMEPTIETQDFIKVKV